MFNITNIDHASFKESLQNIMELNKDELFYKEYYESGKSSKQLELFLKQVDRTDAIKRHLVIPEILPEIIYDP